MAASQYHSFSYTVIFISDKDDDIEWIYRKFSWGYVGKRKMSDMLDRKALRNLGTGPTET